MFPKASLNTQRFATKKGPNIKQISLKSLVLFLPGTYQSLYGFDRTNKIDTSAVIKMVTGRKSLNARLGNNSIEDQDPMTKHSLKTFCNIGAPFKRMRSGI